MKTIALLIIITIFMAGCTRDIDTSVTVEKAEILNQGFLDINDGRVAMLRVISDKVPAPYVFMEDNPGGKLVNFFKKLKPDDKIILKGYYKRDGLLAQDKDDHKKFLFQEIIIIGSGERYQR